MKEPSSQFNALFFILEHSKRARCEVDKTLNERDKFGSVINPYIACFDNSSKEVYDVRCRSLSLYCM